MLAAAKLAQIASHGRVMSRNESPPVAVSETHREVRGAHHVREQDRGEEPLGPSAASAHRRDTTMRPSDGMVIESSYSKLVTSDEVRCATCLVPNGSHAATRSV